MDKKFPLKAVALAARTKWSKNESVANHSEMGWAECIKQGVKTPMIVHRRVRDDIEKKMKRATTR